MHGKQWKGRTNFHMTTFNCWMILRYWSLTYTQPSHYSAPSNGWVDDGDGVWQLTLKHTGDQENNGNYKTFKLLSLRAPLRCRTSTEGINSPVEVCWASYGHETVGIGQLCEDPHFIIPLKLNANSHFFRDFLGLCCFLRTCAGLLNLASSLRLRCSLCFCSQKCSQGGIATWLGNSANWTTCATPLKLCTLGNDVTSLKIAQSARMRKFVVCAGDHYQTKVSNASSTLSCM